MTTNEQPYLTLNNGLKMPQVGLGTWNGLGTECEDMVYNAIKVGYRHIDTARVYNNEDQVGIGIKRAIADNLVKRENLFVTTKLWNDDHQNVEIACKDSLDRLGLDYIDLYLIHWPVSWHKDTKFVNENADLLDTWKEMEKLVTAKKWVNSIGVSNYIESELENIFNTCTIKPVVNQVEIHPYFNNFKLQRFCLANNVFLTAYSALMPESPNYICIPWKNLTADPLVVSLAHKYQKSPQQLLLRWQIDVGNSVITKSSQIERLVQNFDIINFQLDKDDVILLNSFPPQRYRNPHDFKLKEDLIEEWFFKDE